MYLPPPTFDFGTWWEACPERKPKDRFFARLASEIFLSSLQTQFLSNLLVLRSLRHCNRRSMNYRIITLPNILSAC
jgi:hypothetical protein